MASGPNHARAVQEPDPDGYPPPRRAWYVVAVLTGASIFAFIDRQILSLLVAPIRRDLEISDTQMSLLLGAGFAVCFTLFAIPIGRFADRRSRRAVLASGLAGWSFCTAGAGLARTFGQMMLFRMGVGIGEASLGPCSYSIIHDLFPQGRRATALSVFSTGISIGTGVAFLAGGLVIQFASGRSNWSLPLVGAVRPWQLVMLEVGLAGLVFGSLLWTIREPVRRGASGQKVPLPEVLAYLARNRRTFLCHNLGVAALAMAGTAGIAWFPEMFRRHFHWSIPKFGAYFGIEVVVFGCLGIVAAGRIADRLCHRMKDANLVVLATIPTLLIPISSAVFLAPSGEWAIGWLAPCAALMAAPYGVAAAALQQALPGSIRSQVTALYLLVSNVVGAAIGPTLTAVLTEHVFGREDSLHYSLLIVHVAALGLGTTLLWSGRAAFVETLKRLESEAASVCLG
jgi:MFS family permease